jgi:hypothetical protein
MSMSEMPSRGELELCVIPILASGAELGEAMGSVWPGAHKGAEAKGFRGNVWKDIKRMGWDDISVTLQVGRTVQHGHVGFYQGNNKGPGILDNL